jgi:hypothetical protein
MSANIMQVSLAHIWHTVLVVALPSLRSSFQTYKLKVGDVRIHLGCFRTNTAKVMSAARLFAIALTMISRQARVISPLADSSLCWRLLIL